MRSYSKPCSNDVGISASRSTSRLSRTQGRKNLRYGRGRSTRLRDIDFDVFEGEFIVLLGPSGSGKSTLLNILGGLDTPSGGEAAWKDHNLVTADEAELTRYRREHVGFVFQFYNLIPSLTVWENVALVREIATKPFDVREALELIGLSKRLNHFPSQLSGGAAAERCRISESRRRARRRPSPSAASTL